MPRKIEWTTFFDYSLDFSMAFDKCKRTLTFFATILLVLSYSHHFEMHAKAHDKLLRALTASELMTRALRDRKWLMLLVTLWHSLCTFSARPDILVLTLLFSFHFLSFSFCLVVDIGLCFFFFLFLSFSFL